MDVGTLIYGLLEESAKNPVLLIALLLGVGSLLGSIRVKGFGLGPAAVLFLAIAASAANPNLALPPILGTLGLALFAYTIGLSAGPSFFALLRKGSVIIGFTVVAIIAAAALAVGLGHWLQLPKSVMAGVFAGALTNTPALAAATEQVSGEGPIVGYSITYLFAVVGMLALATLAVRKRGAHAVNQKILVVRNVRVEKTGLPDAKDLAARYNNKVTFSRIMRGDTPEKEGTTEIVTETTVPEPDDILTIVGEIADIEKVIADLGHLSTVILHFDRSVFDFRRITLSSPAIVGKAIQDLKLERKFGATITRVRRGDVDLVAFDELVVLQGDRLGVVAPRDQFKDVVKFFGDSESKTTNLNAASLGIGISLGAVLGLLVWPLPGGHTFELGVAGGTLLVGLILGRTMRSGPFVWTLPYGTSNTLGQLGLLFFLATAGSTAGPALLKAFHSDEFLPILLSGVAITTIFFVSMFLFGRYVAKMDGASLAGAIAGTGTQPAVLAHANGLVNSVNVNLGYALVYPAAMIVKVVLAPLIATLF